MSPLKLKKKRNGAGILLLNRIRIRSKTTTFRQTSCTVQPPLALLTSSALDSTTANNPTPRNPRRLESASEVEGKPKIEMDRKEQQTTMVEDEEGEWAGCVFEGDDTPPVALQSKSLTLNPLGVHLAPMDDVVLATQPDEDVVEEKEDVDEDVGEDEGTRPKTGKSAGKLDLRGDKDGES